MSSQPLRVAVVGGGLSGLTCAIGLLKAGVDVQVYEAASKFGEVGAGVSLGQNAINVLNELGLYEDVRNRILQAESKDQEGLPALSDQPVHPNNLDSMTGWFKYIAGAGDNEILCDFDAKDTVAYGVHRAALLDALVQHIDPARTHFHKRCTHLTETASGRMTIHFQDTTTAEADVVLGADGIKSAVRRYVTNTGDSTIDPHLKFSHCVAYRALVPAAKAAAGGCKIDYSERPLTVCGKDKHLILFTVRGGTIINIAAFVTDPEKTLPERYVPPPLLSSQPISKEAILELFSDFGPEMINLLSCVEKAASWDIDVVYPPIQPENWSRGTVTILGDAAHGMQPHLGAGLGQALEDAYLLSRLVSHPQTNKSNISDVLRAYAAVRQPRAQKVWEGSRRAGDIYEGRAGYDGIRLDELQSLEGFVWTHPVNADFKAAEDILVQNDVFKRS